MSGATPLKKRLILLDIDDTLFSCDTFVEFIKFVIAADIRRAAGLPAIVLAAARYKLGLASNVELKEKALRLFTGLSPDILSAMSSAFVERLFKSALNRKVYDNLKKLVATGRYLTVIISASPSFYIRLIGEKIGAHRTIATEICVNDDGTLSPKISGRNCKGDEKVSRLKDEIDLSDYDLENSYALSDSATDLPMFGVVGRPIAVNPDCKLLETARARGFAII